MLRLIFFNALFLFSFTSFADYPKYTKLLILDKASFIEEIQNRLEKAESYETDSAEQNEYLRETLLQVLARPDRDNTLIDILPLLKEALNKSKAYDDNLLSFTKEALATIKANKLPTEIIATQFFVLENIIAEIRPSLVSNKKHKQIIELIIDADIEVDQKISSYRLFNGMFKTVSPSKTASKILELKKSELKTASK